MPMLNDVAESRTLTVSVRRPASEVYAFASNPENLPRWASGLSRSIRRSGDAWIAETPQGPMTVKFTERNRFGILDHYISLPTGGEVYIPMRVIANERGAEIIFTLFRQPEMSIEKFAEDAQWVERDLKTMKQLLEG